MILNNNKRYTLTRDTQAEKDFSISKSKELVKVIIELMSPHLKVCKEYEPDSNDLRINKAPAVRLPDGELAIAPDIYCKTKNDEIFWIEVKDKAQRFYFSDTGADLHQVLGWYEINKQLNQPVLIIFKDPDFEDCLPSAPSKETKDRFKIRWELFNGKFYGNWLNNLITLDSATKYPCIFKERTRAQSINIMYFNIFSMNEIDYTFIKKLPKEIKNLQCYIRQENKTKELITNIKEIYSYSFGKK